MSRSDFLPPMMARWLVRALGRSQLRGDYPSWEAACAASAPYKTDLTVYGPLAEKLRKGQQKSSRLLSPLLATILLAGERPRILDFGGNLGLVYFDFCHLAADCVECWSVVDLPDIVEYGNRHLADNKLRFYDSIHEAQDRGTPNVVLCFHVLQYLGCPFETISQLRSLAPDFFVVHEFPIATRERFMVQHLLPELGGGTRPVRIFSYESVASAFEGYQLIEEIGLPPWDSTLVDIRQVARIYRRRHQ